MRPLVLNVVPTTCDVEPATRARRAGLRVGLQRAALVLAAAIALAGCKGKDAETRAREAERKIRESIPDVMGAALAQPVTADEVKQVQANLRALNEYLGEATGTLDAVTVSAIQAFQRTHGLKDDGILNEKTKRLLQEAAAKAPPKQG